jgi:hypothetical protein
MQQERPPLEPIVAHGSRMSWAGILRRGDEFPSPKMSQLAVLTTEAGTAPRRYFGRWSEAYRRFTTNLTSTNFVVNTLRPGQRPRGGILCVVHWVDRSDMIRTDKGGVCYGDGWPVGLWSAFVSELDGLPKGTVAQKLRSFADAPGHERIRIVAEWREHLREGRVLPPRQGEGRPMLGESLLPVPVKLVTPEGPGECIFSWAPRGRVYQSLSQALASPEASRRAPNLRNQATYYLECTLAKLHGVLFRHDDWIEDEKYERTSEVLDLGPSFRKLESRRIATLGRLDRFGLTPTK